MFRWLLMIAERGCQSFPPVSVLKHAVQAAAYQNRRTFGRKTSGSLREYALRTVLYQVATAK